VGGFLTGRRRSSAGGARLAWPLLFLFLPLGCGSSPMLPTGSGGATSGASGGGAGSGTAGTSGGAGGKGGAGGVAGHDGGVDAGCNNPCTSLGTTECAANSTIATCADQSAACRSWQTSTTCSDGLACQRLGGPLCFDPNWAAWPMPNDATDVAQGAPNPTHYTDNGDGTVTDNVTGLMWQKTLPVTSPPPEQNWNDANATCKALRLAGFDSWRLPSAIELLSIVDYGKANPPIDQSVFPNTPTLPFWTSSTTPTAGFTYWVVLFDDGRTIPQASLAQTYSYARCVR
jgi:hypothetical protein